MAAKRTSDTKKAEKTIDSTKVDKPAKRSRSDQVIALLKKNKDGMTTAEVREALEVKAAHGLLSRLRDKGLIDEYDNEGAGGSIWALAESK